MKYDWIFVVGKDGVGKSTFAAALGAALKLQVGETSRVLDGPTARITAAISGEKIDYVVAHVRKSKAEFREIKRAIGDEFCEMDAAALMKRAASDGSRIIVGMRRTAEVTAFCEAFAAETRALLVIVCKRDADGSVQPEVEWLALPIATVDEVVNDGSVEQLVATAMKLAAQIA